MTLFADRRPSQRGEVITDVVRGILSDEGRNAPDYGRLWVIHPFAKNKWPSLDELVAVHKRWPDDTAMRRQILLAFGSEPELARKIEIDPTDSWQRRAALR